MDEIKSEIVQIRGTRTTQRAKREKSGIPVVALVGYTNAGKSAIMNRLLEMADKSDKTVLEKDMLFATLDTSQRSVRLETNQEFILIDTVGFVSKLPHALVKAFKATLEEVLYADLLLQVVDAADPDHDFHIQVTNQVLGEIGASDKKKLLIYNKIDLVGGEFLPSYNENTIQISAKNGLHLDLLINKIRELAFSDRVRTGFLIPYDRGDISSILCDKGAVEEMVYEEGGTLIRGEFSLADVSRFKKYELV